MNLGLTTAIAELADAGALSDLSIRAYVAAFRADMTAPDLAAHIDAALSVECWTRYLRRDVVLVASVEYQ
jgi:hypothetical protein